MIDRLDSPLDLLRVVGSVLPRTLLPALLAALEGAVVEWKGGELGEYHAIWGHPYSLHVFGMVLGFALVMRIQIAYARFWEGATQAMQMSAKWADVASQVVCFDEAKEAFDEDAIDFRLKMVHFASLMHACALLEMRQDDHHGISDSIGLNPEDPFLFELTCSAVAGRDSAVGQVALAPARLGDRSPSGMGALPTSAASKSMLMPQEASPAPLQQLLHARRLGGTTERADSFLPQEAGLQARQPKQLKSTAASRLREPATPPRPGARAQSISRRGSLTATAFVASTVLLRGSQRTFSRLARANRFDVVGGVSDDEAGRLASLPPASRCHTVQTWMLRLMTARLGAGGLAIPAPILSRTYQVLSDGTAAAAQAAKIADHPFPFPLRQLLSLMLLAFVAMVPLCISAFIDSVALVPLLSFFVIIGYWGLNEAARELEHPFGLGANHLPLVKYQEQYNRKLAQLLDRSVPNPGYKAFDAAALEEHTSLDRLMEEV